MNWHDDREPPVYRAGERARELEAAEPTNERVKLHARLRHRMSRRISGPGGVMLSRDELTSLLGDFEAGRAAEREVAARLMRDGDRCVENMSREIVRLRALLAEKTRELEAARDETEGLRLMCAGKTSEAVLRLRAENERLRALVANVAAWLRENALDAGLMRAISALLERHATPSAPVSQGCNRPPPGWICTRSCGHEGPCAAWSAQVEPEGSESDD